MADLPTLYPEEEHAFHEEYAKYFRTKRGNFFQSLKVFRGVWDCLQLLNDVWQREMSDLQSLTDQHHLLPKRSLRQPTRASLLAIELSFPVVSGMRTASSETASNPLLTPTNCSTSRSSQPFSGALLGTSGQRQDASVAHFSAI